MAFLPHEKKEEIVDNTNKVMNKVYVHINNGGISISAREKEHTSSYSGDYYKYIKLELEADHFGHTTNKMSVGVTKESLKILSDYFLEKYNSLEEINMKDPTPLAFPAKIEYK
jgi:hypothetical protein